MSASTDRPFHHTRSPGLWDIETLLARLLDPVAPIMPVVGGLGAISALVGLAFGGLAGLLMLAAAGPLLVVAGLSLAIRGLAGRRGGDHARRLLADLAHDPDALLLTDRHGAVLGGNDRARALRGDAPRPVAFLERWCAEPARVVAGLMTEALATGAAELTLGRGEHALRVAVHAPRGPAVAESLLWRFAETAPPAARSLDMLGVPVITLGAQGRLVAANPALHQLLRGDADRQGTQASLAGLVDSLAEQAVAEEQVWPVILPGGAGRMLALRQVGRDGQADILLLPARPFAALTPGAAQSHEFEDLPVALVLLSADGRIRETNRLARALLRLASGERRFFSEVVEGLGRPVADWLDDARGGRALNRPEVLRAVLPAQETFVQIILRRAPGGSDGLVAVISDATEMKSLEARFVQSQKMQAIGQLAGGVAHDFNNLLTAISGHCDLLLLERDHFDPDYEDLVQIHQNANRAAALVRQLLAFSRKQTLTTEVISVESLLEELTHLLTRLVGARIALSLVHDRKLGAIRADRRQLEQVILNLVVNARDAMPMGGEIRIETEALTLDAEREVGRARLPAGDYAAIRVGDTGVGIPADVIDKIFEPFFTTKRPGEGTGLGLSTAYGIVKQMGGFIFVESTEGTGTIFSLYFSIDRSGAPLSEVRPSPHPAVQAGPGAETDIPVAPDPSPSLASAATSWSDDEATGHGTAAADGKDAPASAPPGALPVKPLSGAASGTLSRMVSPGKPAQAGPAGAAAGSPPPVPYPAAQGDGAVVLLVEDEAPVRAFAARALRMQGYLVIEAENGAQALDFLADPSLRVDVFVSDVIMPGLDGPGWIGRALDARPGTPVLFVSGYAEDAVSAALRRIPQASFLAKPFSLHDLAAAIGRQLAGTA